MNFTTELYNADFNIDWDKFVDISENGTLFHTRRFLSYHPAKRFKDHSLIFKSRDKIKALFPAAEVLIDKDKTLVSHRGSSYGGFIYFDLGIHDAFACVTALKEHARAEGFTRVILTPAPLVYMKRYSNYLDFALLQNGFRYMKREISSVLQLPNTSDNILSLFKPEARTATRKSIKKGIVIKRSEDYERYYEILEQNLAMRHHVKPTHSLDELKRLVALFPDKIHLWGAYLENKMIAGVVNFICNSNVVLAFYISDDKSYQAYRPVNNLFYHIFQWAISQGFSFYDFGIFTVNMDPNWGLGKFKESFGARGLFRDTFEILL